MLTNLRTSAIAFATATAGFVATPERVNAQTYQIDCAILLCLAGGWPASVPCAHARVEFIRRITPWPIEPPLQIWRCPMGVSHTADPESLSADRIYEILLDLDAAPRQSYPIDPVDRAPIAQPALQRVTGGNARRIPEDALLTLVQHATNGTSDIDISGPEFNFVRSIRVFDVTINDYRDSRSEGGSCNRESRVREGRYGTQGDFRWRRVDRNNIPNAFGPTTSGCSLKARAVFVEWRDYEGNYGFERVDY